jgi:hypothetical protein
MSNRSNLRRGRLAGIALAMVVIFALPAAAHLAGAPHRRATDRTR